MSGQDTADRVASIISQHGESMTLKRQGQSNLTVYGHRERPKGADGDMLAADLAQNDIIVKISNAEIAASALTTPPKKGHRLVIAGKEYTLLADADTRVHGGVTIDHRLLVRG